MTEEERKALLKKAGPKIRKAFALAELQINTLKGINRILKEAPTPFMREVWLRQLEAQVRSHRYAIRSANLEPLPEGTVFVGPKVEEAS